MDEDLDEEDVDDGDWLSFRLRIQGDDYDNPLDENPAFTEEDNDPLTFSLGADSPAWLQIDDKGRLTNKAEMLPERGAYTVTVIATDPSGNSAESSFTLAVAISDDDDRDNDRPDVRDVIEYDYTEGSGSRKVAEFTVRDEDLEIAPHPYGVHEVTLGGSYANRFKLVELGDEDNDPQTAQYAIHTKSAAELAVDDKGKALKVPVKPIDYEDTEEVDITVTVTDGKGRDDERDITIDVNDVDDEAPAFSDSTIKEPIDATRATDKDTKLGTTSLTVNQEQSDKIVVVVQLSEVWSDEDSDEDDLEFEVWRQSRPARLGNGVWPGRMGRHLRFAGAMWNEGDAPDGTRDGDMVIAIVIDRTTGEDGDNESIGKALASFTLTATDEKGNSTKETFSINVSDTNVPIVEDEDDPVVSIGGTASGTGHLTMAFGADQDPDLDEPGDAVLVLYTWSTFEAEDDDQTADVDESMPAPVMVSTSPQILPLADQDGDRLYLDKKIMASVEYYEVDPVTGEIAKSKEFSAVTDDYIEAPAPGEGEDAEAMFDFTTNTDGLVVGVTVANEEDPIPTPIVAVLQVSEDGDGGWITSIRDGTVSLPNGAGTVNFAVDADADGDNGDGGGLYYRVVLTYGPVGDQTSHTSGPQQLGDVTTDPTTGLTPIIGGANPAVGEILRINTDGDDAEVQWQYRDDADSPWMPVEGGDELTLEVASGHAGKMLRAKVTYTAEDDATTTDVDEEGWPIWVEYTDVRTVSGDIDNNAPAATQAAYEIRVELAATKTQGTGDDMVVLQPAAIVEDSVADLFFDSDGDDLTYTITTAAPDLADTQFDNTTTGAGHDAMTAAGDQVYSSYTTVVDTGDQTMEISRDLQQTFAVDDDGGVTYFTDRSGAHDGDTATDGAGNTVVFTVTANDGMTDVDDRPSVPRYGSHQRGAVGH